MTIIGKAIVVEAAKVEEPKEVKVEAAKVEEPTKAEIVAQLTELGIEFDKKATKTQLIELLPNIEETEEE